MAGAVDDSTINIVVVIIIIIIIIIYWLRSLPTPTGMWGTDTFVFVRHWKYSCICRCVRWCQESKTMESETTRGQDSFWLPEAGLSLRYLYWWPDDSFLRCIWNSSVQRRDIDRVKRFRLTLRFFDDVLTTSWFTFSIPTSNFSTTRRNFQSVLSMLFLFSLKSSC